MDRRVAHTGGSVGKHEKKNPLERPRRRWKDNTKTDRVGWEGVGWFDLAQDKHGNVPSHSMKVVKFLN